MNKHFEGTTINYIACLNVDYKSEREEAFQDLQLNVKGCKDVYDSFDEYCEPEVMDGQNQYQAEGHGLQVIPGFRVQGSGLRSYRTSARRRGMACRWSKGSGFRVEGGRTSTRRRGKTCRWSQGSVFRVEL